MLHESFIISSLSKSQSYSYSYIQYKRGHDSPSGNFIMTWLDLNLNFMVYHSSSVNQHFIRSSNPCHYICMFLRNYMAATWPHCHIAQGHETWNKNDLIESSESSIKTQNIKDNDTFDFALPLREDLQHGLGLGNLCSLERFGRLRLPLAFPGNGIVLVLDSWRSPCPGLCFMGFFLVCNLESSWNCKL